MKQDNKPRLPYRRKIYGTREDREKYQQALGEFVTWFSSVEGTLQLLLWRVANVETAVAQSIFSDTGVKKGVDYLRRIHEARETPICKMLDGALSQLLIINGMRNTILHHGASFVSKDELEISNRLFAFNERVLKLQVIKVSTLVDLSEDLARIEYVFAHSACDLNLYPEMEIPSSYLADLRKPWRYMPPNPKGAHQKKPKGSSKQQLGHKPSSQSRN